MELNTRSWATDIIPNMFWGLDAPPATLLLIVCHALDSILHLPLSTFEYLHSTKNIVIPALVNRKNRVAHSESMERSSVWGWGTKYSNHTYDGGENIMAVPASLLNFRQHQWVSFVPKTDVHSYMKGNDDMYSLSNCYPKRECGKPEFTLSPILSSVDDGDAVATPSPCDNACPLCQSHFISFASSIFRIDSNLNHFRASSTDPTDEKLTFYVVCVTWAFGKGDYQQSRQRQNFEE